jgi:hypothetical protein
MSKDLGEIGFFAANQANKKHATPKNNINLNNRRLDEFQDSPGSPKGSNLSKPNRAGNKR